MLDNLIFLVLPYVALTLLVAVTPYRYLSNRLTWSAYSTELLERKLLYWGSNPWHYGIIPILLAHLITTVVPGPVQWLLGRQPALLILEGLGLGLGLFAFFGMALLLVRRGNSPMLKRVTYLSDWIILVLLLIQAGTGIYIAYFLRWGSLWYLNTAVPYFWSILSFNPQLDYMTDLPPVLKLHAAGAFLIIGLVPFTKLVHLLFLPVDFLNDPPIVYRWRDK